MIFSCAIKIFCVVLHRSKLQFDYFNQLSSLLDLKGMRKPLKLSDVVTVTDNYVTLFRTFWKTGQAGWGLLRSLRKYPEHESPFPSDVLFSCYSVAFPVSLRCSLLIHQLATNKACFMLMWSSSFPTTPIPFPFLLESLVEAWYFVRFRGGDLVAVNALHFDQIRSVVWATCEGDFFCVIATSHIISGKSFRLSSNRNFYDVSNKERNVFIQDL
jgi:hypothetical protein